MLIKFLFEFVDVYFIVVLCEYNLFISAFVKHIDCPECEADQNWALEYFSTVQGKLHLLILLILYSAMHVWSHCYDKCLAWYVYLMLPCFVIDCVMWWCDQLAMVDVGMCRVIHESGECL